MTCAAIDLNDCYPVGHKEPLRVSFMRQLRDGEALAGTPTVKELGAKTVAAGTPRINTTELTLGHQTVPVGQAVIVPLTITTAKREKTHLRVSCATTNPERRVTEDIEFRTTS